MKSIDGERAQQTRVLSRIAGLVVGKLSEQKGHATLVSQWIFQPLLRPILMYEHGACLIVNTESKLMSGDTIASEFDISNCLTQIDVLLNCPELGQQTHLQPALRPLLHVVYAAFERYCFSFMFSNDFFKLMIVG